MDVAARNLVLLITEYFGLPFIAPVPPIKGVVDVTWGALNLRDKPSTTGNVIALLADGAEGTIINQWQDWFLIEVQGNTGYVSKDYITLVED